MSEIPCSHVWLSFTCCCSDMARFGWGSTVPVNQALGIRLLFTSDSVDWSCRTEASITLAAGVLASDGSDEFSSRTCAQLKTAASSKVMTHFHRWPTSSDGCREQSLGPLLWYRTTLRDHSRPPMGLADLCQLPLPNPASFTPPSLFFPKTLPNAHKSLSQSLLSREPDLQQIP